MKILFIGNSSIVRRRILPVLPSIPEIESAAVASKSNFDKISFPNGVIGTAYSGYETAIDESGADLVYVSTVNSEHTRWAEAVLQRGKHTVVDKPAFLSLADTQRLLDLAQGKGCLLAESTVYAYHPQIKAIQEQFEKEEDAPTRITATFSFPPLPPGNFRYRDALGGGALWDLGPYAITPGRLFFGTEPVEIAGFVSASTDQVETSFSLSARYMGGQSLTGHFGFNSAYRNHVELIGATTVVSVDRIFTTPDSLENTLNVIHDNQHYTVTVPAASPFVCFLEVLVKALQEHDYEQFAENLLSDARTMQRLRDKVIR